MKNPDLSDLGHGKEEYKLLSGLPTIGVGVTMPQEKQTTKDYCPIIIYNLFFVSLVKTSIMKQHNEIIPLSKRLSDKEKQKVLKELNKVTSVAGYSLI